jgi:hypothetical protein
MRRLITLKKSLEIQVMRIKMDVNGPGSCPMTDSHSEMEEAPARFDVVSCFILFIIIIKKALTVLRGPLA